MKKGYIYRITNLINGKIYIGQTNNFKRRVSQHKYDSQKIDNYLYRSIRKYGLENFAFEIIEEAPLTQLNELETAYISKFNSYEKGYNLTTGGDNNTSAANKANSKLAKEEVIFLRKLYDSQTDLSNKEIWNESFKEKISFSNFRDVWSGQTWKEIMPEVFTKKNLDYYNSKGGKNNRLMTDEEVIEARRNKSYYSLEELHKKYSNGKVTLETFKKIIYGQSYQDLPSYKELRKEELKRIKVDLDKDSLSKPTNGRSLSDEEILLIRSEKGSGTVRELYQMYGEGKISFSGFKKVLYSYTCKHLPSIEELLED